MADENEGETPWPRNVRRKDFLLFFFLPFAGVLVIFFIFSSFNRNFIQRTAVAHEIKNPLNSLALLWKLLHKKGPLEVKEEASLGKEEIHKIWSLTSFPPPSGHSD